MNYNIKHILFIIITCFILFLIKFIIESLNIYNFNNSNYKIESFNTKITTNISDIFPTKGDSSTLITLKGNNLDHIGIIIFENKLEDDENKVFRSECILFNEDRNNKMLKISPPPLSDLGLDIREVRKKMKDNGNGYKIDNIYIIKRKFKETTSKKLKYIDLELEGENKNTYIDNNDMIKINGAFFYYIDKFQKEQKCEVPVCDFKIPELKKNESVIGDDMKFIKFEIEKKKENIKELLNKQEGLVDNLESIQDNQIPRLEEFQKNQIRDDLRKQYNMQRFQLHDYIKNKY